MYWLDLLAVQGTLKSLVQHHTSKASVLWCSSFFIVQLSHLLMTTGKSIALTRWSCVGKVMSLLFNMLSRLVIAFLLRSKHLNFMAASHHLQWFWSPQNKVSDCYQCWSPSIFHEVIGPDAMIFIFWMLSFKPTSSLSPRGSLVLPHFLP